MSRLLILGAGTLVLLLLIVGWRIIESSNPPEIPFQTKNTPPPPAPLCPWREPESDLKLFFPDATRYELETLILSGQRLELAERLGRAPTGDENALHVHPIYRDATRIGTVLTRRVKGAFGAIEIVLAVNAHGAVCGLRLQRLREPEPIAAALQNPAWLRSFDGRRGDGSWKPEGRIPEAAPEARASAEAIADGVRSLLILLATFDESRSQSPVATPHP